MRDENESNGAEFLLIEKSLRGELTAEEAESFAEALERSAEVRRLHDEARELQEVLRREDDRGVARIDWEGLGRSAGRLALRNTLRFVAYAALTVLCAWAVFETDRVSTRVVMALLAAMSGLKCVELWGERRDFADRCRELPEPEQDFGRNYVALLRKELAECRFSWFFYVLAALVLVLLAVIGNKTAECLTVAGWSLVVAAYQHFFVERPLRRELAEASGG